MQPQSRQPGMDPGITASQHYIYTPSRPPHAHCAQFFPGPLLSIKITHLLPMTRLHHIVSKPAFCLLCPPGHPQVMHVPHAQISHSVRSSASCISLIFCIHASNDKSGFLNTAPPPYPLESLRCLYIAQLPVGPPSSCRSTIFL